MEITLSACLFRGFWLDLREIASNPAWLFLQWPWNLSLEPACTALCLSPRMQMNILKKIEPMTSGFQIPHTKHLIMLPPCDGNENMKSGVKWIEYSQQYLSDSEWLVLNGKSARHLSAFAKNNDSHLIQCHFVSERLRFKPHRLLKFLNWTLKCEDNIHLFIFSL